MTNTSKILLAIVSIAAGMYYSFTTKHMEKTPTVLASGAQVSKAYFAGGCFWCMEGISEAQDGVA